MKITAYDPQTEAGDEGKYEASWTDSKPCLVVERTSVDEIWAFLPLDQKDGTIFLVELARG